DIRVIAATNRDPEEAVAEGVLRRDLYFRLNVVPIRVPPLRARREDIPLLAQHFLRKYAEKYGRDGDMPLRLSPDALRALMAHSWPGNVRELQNLMERIVSLAIPGQEVTAADLPDKLSSLGCRRRRWRWTSTSRSTRRRSARSRRSSGRTWGRCSSGTT